MKELLLKLSEKMPEGWVLKMPFTTTTNQYIRRDSDGYTLPLSPELGDIGLAPLTALLKQSLGGLRITNGTYEAGHSKAGQPYWSVWCDGLRGGLHFEEVSLKETEFEAVAKAYLAVRQ